jgi:hypothetical protein
LKDGVQGVDSMDDDGDLDESKMEREIVLCCVSKKERKKGRREERSVEGEFIKKLNWTE